MSFSEFLFFFLFKNFSDFKTSIFVRYLYKNGDARMLDCRLFFICQSDFVSTFIFYLIVETPYASFFVISSLTIIISQFLYFFLFSVCLTLSPSVCLSVCLFLSLPLSLYLSLSRLSDYIDLSIIL